MEKGALSYPEAGPPQGGVISPLLSNIYLHEVLDEWFVTTVQPRLKGRGFMVRYADDFVMGFECLADAQRVMKALPGRFGRHGLKLHEGKTRRVRFGKPEAGPGEEGGNKPETFELPGASAPALRAACGRLSRSARLLGFTHHWAKSRQGRWFVRRKTARQRLSRALKTIHQWCRKNRHRPVEELMRELGRKLRGHYAYYGIMCNYRSLAQFYEGASHRLRWWLNRRSRPQDGMSWERFKRRIREAYPLPPPRIVHSI